MSAVALAAGLAAAAAGTITARRRSLGAAADVFGRAVGRRHLWWLLGGYCVLLAVLALRQSGFVAVTLVIAGSGTAMAVRGLVVKWQDGTRMRRRQLAVIELCDALAAELRAGLPAGRALERASAGVADWAMLPTAVRLDGDVPAALRRCAQLPGAEGLRVVASGWEVAGRSGAAQAVVLDRVAAGLRSDDEARAEVVAALGPPRATAKMLAVLPLFGLGLGVSMGARPLDFLLQTGPGLACLCGGVCLALVGVFWVERLAAAAEV